MSDGEEKTPIVMCAWCWKIQAPDDHLTFGPDEWVDPTTFMAQLDTSGDGYSIQDGYCDDCLADYMSRLQHNTFKTVYERVNA